MYAITKFNYSFKCISYMTPGGVDFTLHLDKALLTPSWGLAQHWMRVHEDTCITEVRTS